MRNIVWLTIQEKFIVDISISNGSPAKWKYMEHTNTCFWNVVLPPHGKRPPGRPKTKRHTQLREDGFKKAKITCNNCGQYGYNKKTWKNIRPYDQELKNKFF